MNLPIIPIGNEEDLRKASKNGTKKNVPSLLHKGLKIFLMDDIILERPSLHRDARHIGRRKAAGFFHALADRMPDVRCTCLEDGPAQYACCCLYLPPGFAGRAWFCKPILIKAKE